MPGAAVFPRYCWKRGHTPPFLWQQNTEHSAGNVCPYTGNLFLCFFFHLVPFKGETSECGHCILHSTGSPEPDTVPGIVGPQQTPEREGGSR